MLNKNKAKQIPKETSVSEIVGLLIFGLALVFAQEKNVSVN